MREAIRIHVVAKNRELATCLRNIGKVVGASLDEIAGLDSSSTRDEAWTKLWTKVGQRAQDLHSAAFVARTQAEWESTSKRL